MTVHFVFIDDAVDVQDDAKRFAALLTNDVIQVTCARPNRQDFLVPERELAQNIDGYIFDINLRDLVLPGAERFIGSGAGFAQDLRFLQASGGDDGQRPRPIVRLCAAQVFQNFIAGDNSSAEVFDLGFDKETIAEVAQQARAQIASLPDLYEGLIGAQQNPESAPAILGLTSEQYAAVHSGFKTAFELEISNKVHEAASFMVHQFLEPPGLLVNEQLLAARMGVDLSNTPAQAWQSLLTRFEGARYRGRGGYGFSRWWMSSVLSIWTELNPQPLFSLSVEQRLRILEESGFSDLIGLVQTQKSPGLRPWVITVSEDRELAVPADPAFVYPLEIPVRPWLDGHFWCLEQAKRKRTALVMSPSTRARLERDLKSASKK